MRYCECSECWLCETISLELMLFHTWIANTTGNKMEHESWLNENNEKACVHCVLFRWNVDKQLHLSGKERASAFDLTPIRGPLIQALRVSHLYCLFIHTQSIISLTIRLHLIWVCVCVFIPQHQSVGIHCHHHGMCPITLGYPAHNKTLSVNLTPGESTDLTKWTRKGVRLTL